MEQRLPYPSLCRFFTSSAFVVAEAVHPEHLEGIATMRRALLSNSEERIPLPTSILMAPARHGLPLLTDGGCGWNRPGFSMPGAVQPKHPGDAARMRTMWSSTALDRFVVGVMNLAREDMRLAASIL
jgi:hypothetical protein